MVTNAFAVSGNGEARNVEPTTLNWRIPHGTLETSARQADRVMQYIKEWTGAAALAEAGHQTIVQVTHPSELNRSRDFGQKGKVDVLFQPPFPERSEAHVLGTHIVRWANSHLQQGMEGLPSPDPHALAPSAFTAKQ